MYADGLVIAIHHMDENSHRTSKNRTRQTCQFSGPVRAFDVSARADTRPLRIRSLADILQHVVSSLGSLFEGAGAVNKNSFI